jgi:hypothetical protein
MRPRIHFWRNSLLILVAILTCLSACGLPAAAPSPEYSQEDALLLLAAGIANLGMSEADFSAWVKGGRGAGQLVPNASLQGAGEAAQVNEINLWKDEFSAECARLRQIMETTLDGDQKAGAVTLFDQHCQAQLTRLTARAQALEKARMSRAGRGPSLRKFFRWIRQSVVEGGLVDAAILYITGGGGVSFGRIARQELVSRFRREAGSEVRSWAGKKLSREVAVLLKLPGGRKAQAPQSPEDFKLPDSGVWTAECTMNWPGEPWVIRYVYRFDLSARHFTYTLDATWDEQRSENEVRKNTWTDRGSGTLFEDGMLEGPGVSVIKGQSFYSKGKTSDVETHSLTYLAYGAVSSDLTTLWVSRGGEHPNFDADYIRAVGIDTFREEHAEATCTITASP